MWLLPSSRGEPECGPPVYFVYVWLVCRWGGGVFVSNQKNTKEGLQRRAWGRSVWDLGFRARGGGHQNDSKHSLATRLFRACSGQPAPGSLRRAQVDLGGQGLKPGSETKPGISQPGFAVSHYNPWRAVCSLRETPISLGWCQLEHPGF